MRFATSFLVAFALDASVSAEGIAASRQARAPRNQVQRGEYLVTVSGCNDCHTPWKMGPHGPEPDTTRMLSGHPQDLLMPELTVLPRGPWTWAGAATMTAFSGPWGTSYATNLTPDDTGLSNWSEAMFIAALRSGKHLGTSRAILPPMPWQNLAKMTDGDLKAVFAYLRSIPPIKNVVPAPEPPVTPMR